MVLCAFAIVDTESGCLIVANSSTTPEESWFLGFFLSDWCDCNSDFADHFVECAQVVAKRAGVAPPEDCFFSDEFLDSVTDFYGLAEAEKSVPAVVRDSSFVARLYFLSGVFAGGGYVSPLSENVGFKDRDESFVTQVAELLQDFEIFCDVEHLCIDDVEGCMSFFDLSAGDAERLESLFAKHNVFTPW